MGWSVFWEDENRHSLLALPVEFVSQTLEIQRTNQHAWRLLNYLDPYGDCVFNGPQMDDLISELFELKKLEPENNAISGLIELAKKCKSEVHTYIVFYGD